MLTTLAFVLPLSLDSFVAAAALAGRIPRRREQLRVGVLFALCETTVPLIGIGLGAALATAVAGVAGFAAAAIVAALGVASILDLQIGGDRFLRKGSPPMGLLVALAISVDELAIGVSGGLSRVSLLPLIALIALQALLAPQAGFIASKRIQSSQREYVERAAGIALLALAAALVLEQLHVI